MTRRPWPTFLTNQYFPLQQMTIRTLPNISISPCKCLLPMSKLDHFPAPSGVLAEISFDL